MICDYSHTFFLKKSLDIVTIVTLVLKFFKKGQFIVTIVTTIAIVTTLRFFKTPNYV